MKWQLPLEIEVKPTLNALHYNEDILTFGSCFITNIGNKLIEGKFKVNENPFGVLYNPASIVQAIQTLLNRKLFTTADLFQHNGLWASFYHHSSFSSLNRDEAIEKMNDSAQEAQLALEDAHTIMITLGTAFCYHLVENNNVVANCHKLPSKNFNQKLLQPIDIINSFQSLIEKIARINSKVQWVFTVSPIRHWKNGAIGNSRSKAILMVAIQELVERYNQIHYFPSYEIMIDELRDYRFYKEDMLHPNNQAINYIWRKFISSYIDSDATNLYQKIIEIKSACNHKAFNFKNEEHQLFIKKTIVKIDNLVKNYPFLDFSIEKRKILDSYN